MKKFWKAYLAGFAALVFQQVVEQDLDPFDLRTWLVAVGTALVVVAGPKNKEA